MLPCAPFNTAQHLTSLLFVYVCLALLRHAACAASAPGPAAWGTRQPKASRIPCARNGRGGGIPDLPGDVVFPLGMGRRRMRGQMAIPQSPACLCLPLSPLLEHLPTYLPTSMHATPCTTPALHRALALYCTLEGGTWTNMPAGQGDHGHSLPHLSHCLCNLVSHHSGDLPRGRGPKISTHICNVSSQSFCRWMSCGGLFFPSSPQPQIENIHLK